MRSFHPLLLMLLATCAWTVEYQRLTFSDGSVRIGWFDERKGILTLDDGATIAVRVDDIVRRETVVPQPRPIHIPPAPTGPADPGRKEGVPAGAATVERDRGQTH